MRPDFRSLGYVITKAVVTLAAGLLLVPAAPTTADAKRCMPVRDVAALDGSRYEGSDIYRIRALDISCKTARRTAVRATLRGMYLGAGVQTYHWRRWRVRRDLAGPVDSYRAAVSGTDKWDRWLFGDL
jgi:hypothetical protein